MGLPVSSSCTASVEQHYFLCPEMLLQIFHLWLMSFLLRAPEITLGLPFSEAVDVWGVGCILVFLYLAQHLFSIQCKYQMVFII